MARRNRSVAALASTLAALALLTAAGCGTGTPRQAGTAGPSPSAAASSTSPAATAPASPSASASVTACDSLPWRQAPFTGQALTGTGTPAVVTGVRTAQHPECGYDRVVIDLTGGPVRYSVRYEARVIADASGQLISLPGAAYLLITIRPAQAHRDSGGATISREVHVTGYPQLRSWVISGDFEAVVSVALGLSHHSAVRVGALPGRLYIDVAQ
jgi:hypothetical protein